MKDFRDLKVWERAHLLTLNVYKITAAFPRDERFGLTSQVGRCNVNRYKYRRRLREVERRVPKILQIASGSASELDYHLLLARDLGFLHDDECKGLLQDLTQMRRMPTSLL